MCIFFKVKTTIRFPVWFCSDSLPFFLSRLMSVILDSDYFPSLRRGEHNWFSQSFSLFLPVSSDLFVSALYLKFK